GRAQLARDRGSAASQPRLQLHGAFRLRRARARSRRQRVRARRQSRQQPRLAFLGFRATLRRARPRRGVAQARMSWKIPLAIAAGLFLFAELRCSVENFHIPSGAMAPTLVPGDHIFVNKLAYGPRWPFSRKRVWTGAAPRRGEAIVF